MAIGNNILKIRTNLRLSQEKFAQCLDVSRQAVQKWETETSVPDIEKLILISRKFGVSLDTLILNDDRRKAEEKKYDREIHPQFSSIHEWELYSSNLLTEYRQCREEGLDIQQYENLFADVSKMPIDRNREKMADVLFDIIMNAETVSDYKYVEPSDLPTIRLLRDGYQRGNVETSLRIVPSQSSESGKPHRRQDTKTEVPKNIKEKIHGAWLGRICGCLLGKPVEGRRTEDLLPLLKQSGNYPMHRYILSTDLSEECIEKYHYSKENVWANQVQCAPADDDTNYTVLAGILIERYGRDFTPYDVCTTWLGYQSKNAYCTAERVAFCNFIKGYYPPLSATYKNPFREWIGAQIRADYFGYINPGNPELAAEMAWRDGCISHVKNGIYGEMFVAAMLAQAAISNDMEDIIQTGLSQIPKTSRLYEAITEVMDKYASGETAEACFGMIRKRFDEHEAHDWCHVISNAMIVAASLLYGRNDYGKSICLSVQQGFDTDCNGATVGSVLGMKNGATSIDKKWTEPIHGRLDTSIFGVGTVNISDMVDKTISHFSERMES